ncbi:MAG: hypothetical protein J6Y85_03880 [Alphaproteobacteria bacterium]|nr:hypothetical protein [Alphaproteobacteria bacterium]
MITARSEVMAKEFIVALAFGAKAQAVSFLKQNPDLLNSSTMADAIVPKLPLDSIRLNTFEMSMEIRQLLGECAENGVISKKKLWQAVNTCSPRNGETIATLLIKLMISSAQAIAKAMADGCKEPQHMKNLLLIRKRLNALVCDDSPVKIDVDVPNIRGQYPLHLLSMAIQNKRIASLLAKDYERIDALTSPTVKMRLKRKKTAKNRLNVVDVLALPTIKVKMTTKHGTERCSVALLRLGTPTFLKSNENSLFDFMTIYPKNTYLIASFLNNRVQISPLKNMYDVGFAVHHNGKWVEVPYTGMYTTYQVLTQNNGGKDPARGNAGR